MKEIFDVLKAYPNFVLATVDEAGKPHTRIVQYLFEIGGKLYFCTNSTKNMSKQMKQNPHVSLIAHAPDFSAIARVNGDVTFLDDMALKARALEENPGIKEIYHSADNPIFEICAMDSLTVE